LKADLLEQLKEINPNASIEDGEEVAVALSPGSPKSLQLDEETLPVAVAPVLPCLEQD
jgi:hypothetical protein